MIHVHNNHLLIFITDRPSNNLLCTFTTQPLNLVFWQEIYTNVKTCFALSSVNMLIFMNKKNERSEAYSKNDIFKLKIITGAGLAVLFFVLEKQRLMIGVEGSGDAWR